VNTNRFLKATVLNVSLLVWTSKGFGFQLQVEVIGLPAIADSVSVLADGDGLRIPIGTTVHFPQNTPRIGLQLPPTRSQPLRIRAVAFTGDNMLPTVLAIGTTMFTTGQREPSTITMGWPTAVLEKIGESPDGSTTILVSFGKSDFFDSHSVFELRVSGSLQARSCTGSHFLAPLLRTDAGWQTLFVVSTGMCSVTSFELAYLAIPFRLSEQLPVMLWPNRRRNETSLLINSTQTSAPSGQHTTSPQSVEERVPQDQSDPGTSSYIIKAGPDGRLIRVPITNPLKKGHQ
jgi:hypothetical protein